MDPISTYESLQSITATLALLGRPIEIALLVIALSLLALSVAPGLRHLLGRVLMVAVAVLVVGEGLLAWFHWRLYDIAVVAVPR